MTSDEIKAANIDPTPGNFLNRDEAVLKEIAYQLAVMNEQEVALEIQSDYQAVYKEMPGNLIHEHECITNNGATCKICGRHL